MFRTKYKAVIAGVLISSTISAILSSPTASAATQTLAYDCGITARNVTLNVTPGDVLNFTSGCGAVFLGAYNSSVISSSSGSGFPSRSFVVSASLASGSYADAIELYASRHHFYTLVYTSPVSDAEIAAAAAAAAKAVRDAATMTARTELIAGFKSSNPATTQKFIAAGISGISDTNIGAVNSEILLLPEGARSSLSQILKIARKYEILGKIGSDKYKDVLSSAYVEINLIPADCKFKASLVSAVGRLSPSERQDLGSIKLAIAAENNVIQKRAEHLAAVRTKSGR